MKIYTGDDKHVVSVYVDKKQLIGYEDADYDFIEQVLLVITDPNAKADLLK